MRLWLSSCLSLYLLLATLPAWCENLQIQVEENKRLNSRHYLLTKGDCKILWRLQFFQAGKGFGIREEVDCNLPPSDHIPFRRALLQKISNDTNQMQGMRNFVWGSVPSRDVFMPRLAQALRASGRWDASKGVWQGSESVYAMRDMMNQQKVFAELATSFADEGWEVAVVDVEKVQIGGGVVADDAGKYPFNCSIVFSVKKKGLR